MILHICIDGLRPDAILPLSAPCINRLMEEGRSTRQAQTVMPSVTLPCHNSMFRSVPPERHGITTNRFMPLARPVPSIIDHVKSKGLKTGMFHNWSELRDLAEPWNIDVVGMNSYNKSGEGDTEVLRLALDALHRHAVDYSFVYFGHVDSAGHQFGWMSDGYMAAVQHADACVNELLETLTAKDPALKVLLLSDHGGHDRGHGLDVPEDMTIPFCVWWSGISHETLQGVSIMDAAPTIAALAGLEPCEDWEGIARI